MNVLRKFLQNRFFTFFLWSLIGFLGGLSLVFIFSNVLKPKYAMVVLENGSIYFGEISFFPRNKLKSPVFVNVGNDGNISLQRFSDAVWKPKNYILLNQSKILFWTYLEDNSPIVDFIKMKSQVLPSPTPRPTSTSSPTSTPTSPIQR
ncbi:MAG: hypothetical protein C4347_02135 [Patescibacteria group bacterium]